MPAKALGNEVIGFGINAGKPYPYGADTAEKETGDSHQRT